MITGKHYDSEARRYSTSIPPLGDVWKEKKEKEERFGVEKAFIFYMHFAVTQEPFWGLVGTDYAR
jgi:hypothetical protein